MSFKPNNNSKKVLTIWIVSTGLVTVFLSSMLAGLISSIILLLTGLLIVLTVALVLTYPTNFIKNFKGNFDGKAITVTMGVFWKQEVFIPVSAIRTFQLNTTPLQRFFKCGTVLIRYAGGSKFFPVLSEKTAMELIKALEKSEFSR